MSGIGSLEPAAAGLRQARRSSHQVHTLGPLRLNTSQITEIRLEAEHTGRVAPEASATNAAGVVGRQGPVIAPTGDRARRLELVRARTDVARIGERIERKGPSPVVQRQIQRAAQRVEAAADAISMAQPGRRPRSAQ